MKNIRTEIEKVDFLRTKKLLLLSRPLLLTILVVIVDVLCLWGFLFSASRFDIAASLQSGLKIPSGTHLSSAPPLYFERMYRIDSQNDLSQTDKYDKKISLYKQVIPFG